MGYALFGIAFPLGTLFVVIACGLLIGGIH